MSFKNIQIPENIKINLKLDLKVNYEKHSGIYKVICNELKVTAISRKSYVEAEERLTELIHQKLWLDGYNLQINIL